MPGARERAPRPAVSARTKPAPLPLHYSGPEPRPTFRRPEKCRAVFIFSFLGFPGDGPPGTPGRQRGRWRARARRRAERTAGGCAPSRSLVHPMRGMCLKECRLQPHFCPPKILRDAVCEASQSRSGAYQVLRRQPPYRRRHGETATLVSPALVPPFLLTTAKSRANCLNPFQPVWHSRRARCFSRETATEPALRRVFAKVHLERHLQHS